MLNHVVLLGIDVGNLQSGVVALLDGRIDLVKTMDNRQVFDVVRSYMSRYEVVETVVEDIKPFAGNLSQQAIDTCKFIGQLTWRLGEIEAKYSLMNRASVRKWVYDNFNWLVLPLVLKKIEKRDAKNNDGKHRKPSFVYIDDSMVLKAMKEMYKIETPPPGKGYEYGLKTHTWQALGLVSAFKQQHPTFATEFPQNGGETPFSGQQVA